MVVTPVETVADTAALWQLRSSIRGDEIVDAIRDRAARYRAFISYAHTDRLFVDRLHRRLERYRLPRGISPERSLAPIFRDREELPAAPDLTATVRTALADAACLVVVCSPASARSRWVEREIELFREINPKRPVLAALVEGLPQDAFPLSLRRLGESDVEPLAADFQRGRDEQRLAFLKLVAGIAGVGLDALIQRDAQRLIRRVTAITLAAVAAMIIMSALTMTALQARAEADRQRREAEGLVEFMLTDLRERLKGVGRLDVLGAVNERALAHYEQRSLDGLPPDSIERRARLFHAMGEDDERSGRLDLALGKWREAHRATEALLVREPDNPERVFAHSQSEYWLGYAAFQRQRFGEALSAFEAYKRLAERLVSLRPRDAEYRREAGFAEGNLCTLALARSPKDVRGALRSCRAALHHMLAAAPGMPKARYAELAEDLANRHAWLGEALDAAGHIAAADAEFANQRRIINGLIAADPKNMELRDTWLTTQLTLGRRERRQGRADEARRRFEGALATAEQMIAFDPDNDVWRRRRKKILGELESGGASNPDGE